MAKRKSSSSESSSDNAIDWNQAIMLMTVPNQRQVRLLKKSTLAGTENLDENDWQEADRRRFLELFVEKDE